MQAKIRCFLCPLLLLRWNPLWFSLLSTVALRSSKAWHRPSGRLRKVGGSTETPSPQKHRSSQPCSKEALSVLHRFDVVAWPAMRSPIHHQCRCCTGQHSPCCKARSSTCPSRRMRAACFCKMLFAGLRGLNFTGFRPRRMQEHRVRGAVCGLGGVARLKGSQEQTRQGRPQASSEWSKICSKDFWCENGERPREHAANRSSQSGPRL